MELLETREGDHLIESNKGVLDLPVRKKTRNILGSKEMYKQRTIKGQNVKFLVVQGNV